MIANKPAMVMDYIARVDAHRRMTRIRECKLRDDLRAMDEARRKRMRRGKRR